MNNAVKNLLFLFFASMVFFSPCGLARTFFLKADNGFLKQTPEGVLSYGELDASAEWEIYMTRKTEGVIRYQLRNLGSGKFLAFDGTSWRGSSTRIGDQTQLNFFPREENQREFSVNLINDGGVLRFPGDAGGINWLHFIAKNYDNSIDIGRELDPNETLALVRGLKVMNGIHRGKYICFNAIVGDFMLGDTLLGCRIQSITPRGNKYDVTFESAQGNPIHMGFTTKPSGMISPEIDDAQAFESLKELLGDDINLAFAYDHDTDMRSIRAYSPTSYYLDLRNKKVSLGETDQETKIIVEHDWGRTKIATGGGYILTPTNSSEKFKYSKSQDNTQWFSIIKIPESPDHVYLSNAPGQFLGHDFDGELIKVNHVELAIKFPRGYFNAAEASVRGLQVIGFKAHYLNLSVGPRLSSLSAKAPLIRVDHKNNETYRFSTPGGYFLGTTQVSDEFFAEKVNTERASFLMSRVPSGIRFFKLLTNRGKFFTIVDDTLVTGDSAVNAANFEIIGEDTFYKYFEIKNQDALKHLSLGANCGARSNIQRKYYGLDLKETMESNMLDWTRSLRISTLFDLLEGDKGKTYIDHALGVQIPAEEIDVRCRVENRVNTDTFDFFCDGRHLLSIDKEKGVSQHVNARFMTIPGLESAHDISKWRLFETGLDMGERLKRFVVHVYNEVIFKYQRRYMRLWNYVNSDEPMVFMRWAYYGFDSAVNEGNAVRLLDAIRARTKPHKLLSVSMGAEVGWHGSEKPGPRMYQHFNLTDFPLLKPVHQRFDMQEHLNWRAVFILSDFARPFAGH